MSVHYRGEAMESGASRAHDAALELFQIAALTLGDEEEAVSLVEQALAGVEADPCADAGAAQDEARPRLVDAVMRRLVKMHPAAFAILPAAEEASPCIDAGDLGMAGITRDQLAALLQGPGRAKMREWLEQMEPALRAIFVLRAVAGQDAEQTVQALRRSGGAGVQSWRREHVGAAYRQALCSLASSLVTSSVATEPV